MGYKAKSGRGLNVLAGLVIGCAAFAACGAARTRGAVMLSSASPVASGSNFNYAYSAYLFDSSSALASGNQIIIPDFAGYQPGSYVYTPPIGSGLTASDFTLTTPATVFPLSANGVVITPVQSPLNTNLVLTYSGSTPVTVPGGSFYTNLGTFTFSSSIGGTTPGSALYSDTYNHAPEVGSNPVLIPATTGTVSPVPLPAAFWPGLLTLAGLAFGARFRRRAALAKV